MIHLLALTLSFCTIVARGEDSTLIQLQSYLNSEARAFRLNGSVLVASHGRVLLDQGYGWRNLKKQVPHDSTSLFQIGSVTKQFTAALILKLQASGKLSIQDFLSKYFPDYPGGSKITLHELLTHTSGIPEYIDKFQPYDFFINKSRSHEEVLRKFRNKPLAFEPGQNYAYSSSGYFLLGLIIEKVLGQPYEKVVRDSLFLPLGMLHSGFDFRELSDITKSTGYSLFQPGRNSEAADMDSSILYSAGGIYSSTGDLYHWLQGYFHGEVLDSASRAAALTPFLANYGYGWRIGSMYGQKIYAHGGNTANFNAYVLYLPAIDLTVIVLQNDNGDGWSLCAGISRILLHQSYEWGDEPELSLDTAALRSFTGTYSVNNKNQITIKMEGQRLSLYGTPGLKIFKHSLVAIDTSSFYLKEYSLRLDFVKSLTGSIDKVILTKGGSEWDCSRLQ